MQELIDRLKAAERPDAEIGRAVLLAHGWRKTCVGRFLGELWHWSSPDGKISFPDDHFFFHDPTRSVDAAMALFPGGINIIDLKLSWDTSEKPGHPACTVRWYPPQKSGNDWHAAVAGAPNAALAICIAATEARDALLANHASPTGESKCD